MGSVTIPAKYFEDLEGLLHLDQGGCEEFVRDALNSYLHLCLASVSGVDFVARLPVEQRGYLMRSLRFPFDHSPAHKTAVSPEDLAQAAMLRALALEDDTSGTGQKKMAQSTK